MCDYAIRSQFARPHRGLRLAPRSFLDRYELGVADEKAHLTAVTAALAAFGDSVRKAIDEAAAFGDQDTSDVFTEVSRGVDYQTWLVESHLHL